jgi:lysophospholipid acyltransferase (LPLAT)-like uncharacterized protein
MKNRILDLPHFILQHLIWYLIKMLVATYRIERRGLDKRDQAKALSPNQTFIFAVWHEQVVSVMSGHAYTEPFLALSSRSKDGDYAAFVSKKLGFYPVRGSSRKKNKDKGGKEAIQTYVAKITEGFSGGITVDGPKGPRQVCKTGVALIAQQTGSPILPVVGVPDSYWEFNSWDKFKLPRPFSRIMMEYGSPIQVEASASEADIELACEKVTQELKRLEQALLKGKRSP